VRALSGGVGKRGVPASRADFDCKVDVHVHGVLELRVFSQEHPKLVVFVHSDMGWVCGFEVKLTIVEWIRQVLVLKGDFVGQGAAAGGRACCDCNLWELVHSWKGSIRDRENYRWPEIGSVETDLRALIEGDRYQETHFVARAFN